MANRSNETSRQKRARENRARRAALEARRKAANTPAADRYARTEPSRGGAKEGGSKAEGRGPGSARQAMAQGRLGQAPVDIDSLQGSFLGKVVHVPGGMQVIMAAVLVLVLIAMGVFMDTVPPEGADPGANPTRTLVEAYGASAILFIAPPVILVGNALFFSLHERRRRMWVISAVMMVIFSALMLQFVFPAAFLAYAAWRSKRIEEGPPTRAARAADAKTETEPDAETRTDVDGPEDDEATAGQ